MRKCRIGTAKFFTLLLLLYRTSVNYHGFSEPELSIAIKQIKQLRAINVRLLDILNENNLISKEQKEAIETELTKEELKKESYIYSQVDDIDEWW